MDNNSSKHSQEPPHPNGRTTKKSEKSTHSKENGPDHMKVNATIPDTSGSLFSMKAFNAERDLPIVYSDHYNMSMIGVELIHQFDTKKYKKIADMLSDEFMDTPYSRYRQYDERKEEGEENKVRPRRLRYLSANRPVDRHELEIHHTKDYVDQVHTVKSLVARITEIWILNLAPTFVIESRLLIPMRWQVAGTIYAAHLAMQHGWAINLGGGFHQASADDGETFCIFSDICITMKYIWRKHPLQKFMIIDLDAHQATGLERDISELSAKKRKGVYMVDVFNSSIQPPDPIADKGVDIRVELARFTGDKTYLSKLENALKEAFNNYKPTLVIYVAGQDVLKDDQLGLMNVSEGALRKRDEMVFSMATEVHKCPIVMLLAGGYMARGARIQVDSIRNLFAKNLIWGGFKSGNRSLSRPRHFSTETTNSFTKKTIDTAKTSTPPLHTRASKEHSGSKKAPHSFKKLQLDTQSKKN